MKRAALACFVLGGCAGRTPPHATFVEANRAGTTIEELEHGRKLVIAKCSRCHDTPLPDDRSAAAWPGMIDEMAPRAKVTADERRAIERYLVAMTKR